MRNVLIESSMEPMWSKRARGEIAELRAANAFLAPSQAPLVREVSRVRWWTFAGGKANHLLATLLREKLGENITANNLCVSFGNAETRSDIELRRAIENLAEPDTFSWENVRSHGSSSARGRLTKFQPCLPEKLDLDLTARALLDIDGARQAVVDFCRRQGNNLLHMERS